MDVSVIVPVYNVEKYIRPSLKSLVNQTYRDFEIILVDDGSTDSSGTICDEFAKQDDRITVIHKKNEGTGLARNTGIDAARGDYLYFCDPDDIFDSNLIEDNIKLAKKHDADIVAFGYRRIYRNGNDEEISREPDDLPRVSGLYTREQFAQEFRTAFNGQYLLWSKIYRRSLLEDAQVRSTDQKIGQDVLLLLDILTTPFKTIYFNQQAYYNYILHPKSVTTMYRTNRFECEFNTAKRKERLINSLAPHVTDSKLLIAKGYLDSVNMAFGAFSVWDAPKEMTFKQQLEILNGIFAKEKMKKVVQETGYSVYNTKTGKLKLFLFKHKCYRSIILIGRIIGKKYRRF